MDIEYVRIKDPSGAEFTYDTAKVVALGLEQYVIEKPALGPDGLPAPTKPHVPLGEALPGSEADLRNQKAAVEAADAAQREQWTEHAKGLGIEVPEGATTTEVVELVEAHEADQQDPGANVLGQDAGQSSAAQEEN